MCAFLATPCAAAPAADSAATAGHASGKRIWVIPVSGTVEPGMAVFLGRAVRTALADKDAVAVLEMDTFGGQLEAAFQIVDTLLQFPPDRVVAYVKNKAISAGALIALACGSLYMKHNTTIGDCAPIMMGEEGPKMLGEKIQSPLRAKFRSLARRGGFPQALAEAMVSDNIIVYRLSTPDSTFCIDSIAYAELKPQQLKPITHKETVVKRGELLTMDDAEALDLGFSRGTLGSVEDLAAKLGVPVGNVQRVEQNWSETFVRFLTTIAPILMLLGFAGIYMEIKTPGSLWPGIAGGLCLALAFLGQYMVGLANYTELLLLVVGAALIMVEIFVLPGTGLFAIAGVGFIAVGMVLSMQGFVLPRPDMPWQQHEVVGNIFEVLGLAVGALVISVAVVRYVLPHLGPAVDGPYLKATMVQSHVDSDSARTLAVGDSGVAEKPLRPAGMVRFGGEVLDAQTEGDFIEGGAQVVVVRVEGNHIFVARRGAA
jgi:membrane-bound serine protease (ClpP class)